jgi:archaeal flagellar protein FlaG
MSAETFTTAMFLITAVIAAGVLVNAVFPVVYNMAGTFSSASHESDTRMRTDYKIVATTASGTSATIWMKNIGSQRIAVADIRRSDVFCGAVGNFVRLDYVDVDDPSKLSDGEWTEFLKDLNTPANGYWDTGETLQVSLKTTSLPATGNPVYFQFVLPNGVWRSNEFTAS